MAIPAERYPVETVRKPGDFARHPKTGAPYVSDPTATRQPAGTKAELLAKCEARGIATPDDPKDITVKRLRELLGPEARMVQYGRPSSLGKQIENMTNLQKWSERAVALGCYLDGVSLMAEICEVGDDKLNLDDPDVRTLLDSIAVKAKNIAQAGIAAERGTHTHALTEDSDNERDWIERARSGEDLGIPEAAQRALVAAWEQMLVAEGIEILAVETAVVDDEWRQAGTLDRIARLGRPRNFTRPGGEIVTLPAGWVGVLDVKGLALDTKLPTPTGWTTIGAVEVGDQVIGSDGRPCDVLYKSPLRDRPCYRIRFDDGTEVVADDEHRWAVESGKSGGTRSQVLTTAEIAATLRDARGQAHHRVLNPAPLQLPAATLPIHPYVLGVWLGDGKHTSGEITKPVDNDVWRQLTKRGCELGKLFVDARTGCATRTVLGLVTQLRAAGLHGNKHVPDVYLRSADWQRLDLLQGLMDSDGTWNKARNRATFTSTNKSLSLAVYELVASLGERPHLSEVQRSGFGVTVTAYDVEWAPYRHMPFAEVAKRDRAQVRLTGRNDRRVIVAVDEIPSVPTQCIAVDSPHHTYLCTEAMIVTHNTGRLRAGKDGHPDYWHGYAVQIASYAQSVPYDPDTDTRGTWDWPIDQQYGIIAHLDVQSALDGEACCRLVLVDLAAGREAGERCVWGRSWEKRRDVFSLVVDDGVTVPVEQIAAPVPVSTVEQRAAGPEGYSTAPPVPAVDRFPGLQGVRTDCVTGVDSVVDLEYEVRVGHDGERWLHLFNGPTGYESCPVERMLADLAANPDRPGWSACAGTPKRWDRLVVTSESLLRVFGAKMVPAVDRRQLLKDRSDRIIAGCRNLDYADAIRRGGPVPKVGPHEARFRAELKAHGISPASTDDEVQAALDAIEPPFDPEPQVVVETSPPNPQPVIEPPDDGGPLDQHTLATLLTTIAASPQRAVVNAWLKQASDAGQSWNPRIHPTVRHFEIARAAFATAIAVDGGDDYARLILAHVVDEAAQPAFPVGVIFGALTIDEARRVTAIAEAFGTRLTLMCHEDGTPWLDGDVAAVLGEAVLV